MEDHDYRHNEGEETIEHLFQESIICPYCGYDYGYAKSQTMPGNTTNAWKFYVECKICHKMFSAGWDFDNDENEEDGLNYTTWQENQEDFVKGI